MSEWLSCRPNLEVADLGQASAFLRDVLGFTVDLEEQAVGLVLLSRDAVGLALVRAANPGVNDTTAAYIGVAGVDDLYGHCQRRGATIVTPLTEHPWGLRDFVIEIPGGHRLAFGERIERLLAQPGCPGAGTRELEPGHGRRASSRRHARTAVVGAACAEWFRPGSSALRALSDLRLAARHGYP